VDTDSELEFIKTKLKNINRANIIFNQHSLLRIQQRFLSYDVLVKELLNPDGLYRVDKQTSNYTGESKYKLSFKSSNRIDLVIIVVFQNNHVEVITAYSRSRKIKPKFIKRR
jgi:hypothetical protein